MTTIRVHIPEQPAKQYPVHMELDALSKLRTFIPCERYSRVVVLTDTTLSDILLPKLLTQLPEPHSVIEIPPGESSKNFDALMKVLADLMKLQVDRKGLLINLGGGVIGDLGGFAASIYHRGIDFVQIPTTLLAQVDASLGGKLGIDFGDKKNPVGIINQPLAVIIDPLVLSTLPKRELISGYAEILKHGAIADAEYFALAASKRVTDCSAQDLCQIIIRSCQIKLAIVEQDEKESGPRKVLNFGHTFDHALEALSLEGPSPLTHGEAVSLGMCFEAFLSFRRGVLPRGDYELLRNALCAQGLPTSFAQQERANQELWTYSAVLDRMMGDKKNAHGKILWSLIDKIGSCVYDIEVPAEELSAALETWAWDDTQEGRKGA